MEIPPDLTASGIYIGTSGYYYDDWIGRFNPPRMSAARKAKVTEQEMADQDRLQFYQKYFSFVEINNTFYQEPVLGHFVDIESRSKPSMMYTVKVHRAISHGPDAGVADGCDAMERHIDAVSPLVETGRFYSFLIQLDDHVYRSIAKLDYLLAVSSVAVKRHCDVHIEFRHISWHNEKVLTALKNNGVGICNTDFPPVKHAFPLKSYATTSKGYLRYSGRNLANWYPQQQAKTSKEKIIQRNARYDYEYSEDELAKLVDGQQKIMSKTTQMAVAYNNHFQAQAIKNAMRDILILKARLGICQPGDAYKGK